MCAGMEQICNFLPYTIMRGSQDTAYIELRVKIHDQDGIKDGGSPLLTLSNLLNYKQATCETDSVILGWAVGVGIEQSCNFLLYTIIMERQETAYI